MFIVTQADWKVCRMPGESLLHPNLCLVGFLSSNNRPTVFFCYCIQILGLEPHGTAAEKLAVGVVGGQQKP